MISIVICSKNSILDKKVLTNIKSTVGIAHELLIIDNSKKNYSIFEAYNLGIQQSTSSYLVFLHDDVFIHTNNWGQIILDIFSHNKNLGLVGIAGSKIKTNVPSTWWDNRPEYLFQNILHYDTNNKLKHEIWGFEKNSSLEEVVVIDGVFMAMKKDPRLKFNERLIGFHNYDQSICMDFKSKGYQICVTNEILVEHLSRGKIDSSWIDSTLKFHRIYKSFLPQFVDTPPTKNDRIFTLFRFFSHCIGTGHKKLAFRFWIKNLWIAPFSKENRKILKRLVNAK